ncbi:methyltransferase [Brevibacterium sp. RIT 803]|uniref:N5-glutamine methyltransferase family protein n=1 Tax=Brevibacterium sp. RIT 803 TaxID=2810210 RepID=UPI00194E79C8|nr:methyltransferase [Brevibacterium sp. RIT 803]MBM6588560.1 methyltransferase [Brevibacterium sp. RIT 803]
MDQPTVVARLRAAGCVFAEDEARILIDAAMSSAHVARSSGLAAERSNSLLAELIARRVAGEPLEQIVGWVEFAGQRLHVAPGVFVPRQRTALLAGATMRAVEAAGAGARFLEAFCGVGPVATTVSRALPDTQIHLGDHDETALECARRNVGASVNCHRLTCLSGLPQSLLGSFDVISAVPPYVPDAAAEFLPREAIEHEAPTALFGGADGLDLVRSLIRDSGEWLAPGGVLLIELGREQRHTAAGFGEAREFSASCILGEDEQTTVLELRRLAPARHTTSADA